MGSGKRNNQYSRHDSQASKRDSTTFQQTLNSGSAKGSVGDKPNMQTPDSEVVPQSRLNDLMNNARQKIRGNLKDSEQRLRDLNRTSDPQWGGVDVRGAANKQAQDVSSVIMQDYMSAARKNPQVAMRLGTTRTAVNAEIQQIAKDELAKLKRGE